ncbi:MAG: hypothetical protein JST38_04390, partial [Bacteroidetes bacterium]|nr:hypothetical protein [Bacteroidota bacterium]
NIGNAVLIMQHNDKVAIEGEKGISTHGLADGKLVNSGKYKASTLNDRVGNMALMQTDKEDIAAFDLDSCKFLAYNARKDAMNTLTNDGQYVYVYEKKDVTKLKTH